MSCEVTKPKALVQSILLSVSENEQYIIFYIYHILYTLLMADSSHVQGTRARDLFYGAQSGKIAL